MLSKKDGSTHDMNLALSTKGGLIHKQTGLRIKAPLSLSMSGNLHFQGKIVDEETIVVLGHPDADDTRVKLRETRFRQLIVTNTIKIIYGQEQSWGYHIPDE